MDIVGRTLIPLNLDLCDLTPGWVGGPCDFGVSLRHLGLSMSSAFPIFNFDLFRGLGTWTLDSGS